MSALTTLTDDRWAELLASGSAFTCYSAAIATWLAFADHEWAAAVNPGLWLRLTEEGGGLFGFGYFPPGLRARVALERVGADDPAAALEGVLAEVARSGRVIVAADGYQLPWHVACERVHAPHWFVLHGTPEHLTIADPFSCRNELGTQTAYRQTIAPGALTGLLGAVSGGDPVHRLREMLAFGDLAEQALDHRFQWFAAAEAVDGVVPAGVDGPAALRVLAGHFRTHGQEVEAYRQADDIWSIARHRSFLLACARADGDEEGADWTEAHLAPLARRWGHIAPLLMQATLALRAGRQSSTSVADTLERLAELEASASCAAPRSFLERIGHSG